ncbi:YbaY family lipoprotein [Palleronia sp. KMU-117]|uniref:YbaY family lipoprotein n=1 Tax=Palleronia sp. KMU-117 TaxID=3434108 RepID=UPI003D740ABF
MLFRRFGLAAIAALVAGTGFAMDGVSVTATYRERIAMPPGTVFEARLEDVSRADAPSILIGAVRIEDAGNPPYAVTIDVDPAAIDERFTYAVRASLTHEGRLLFTTDTHVPVLTRGAPDAAEIVMVRVASSEAAAAAPLHGLDLPASFTGDLPCADCEAIRHHLDLWPDQGFHLRRVWIGGAAPLVRDHVGHWSLDPARNALVLWTGGDARLEFAITDAGALRLLDQDGQPIVSDLPYELTSLGRLDPIDIALPMIGAFTHFADAASFVDCRSGRRFPVAMEGDYLALERAYMDARAEPMAPVVATIDGQVTIREGMEGGPVQTVTVDRFDALWPGLSCERARADASFDNTYWRIHWLDGTTLDGVPGTREPHVVFRPDAYGATVGCNRINGGYERTGETGLRLLPGAMTRMACPPPLDEWERRLVEVFGRVTSLRILGPTLALLDDDGAVIARLEAVYLP